jgi:hypothetical protein
MANAGRLVDADRDEASGDARLGGTDPTRDP